MTAHAYSRVRIVGSDFSSGSYTNIYSIDFQDASGVSLCVGGTATASTHWASFSPDRAFPGGIGDWVSNNEFPCWLGYQFLAPVTIGKIVVASGNVASIPYVLVKEDSDDGGATWTIDWILTNRTWTLHTPVTFVAPAAGALSAPYWGLFVDTILSNNPDILLSEIAFLDNASARIAGFFNETGCRNTSSNYDWSDCWDNNPATYVQSSSSLPLPSGHFTTVQYPAPVAPRAVSILNGPIGLYQNYIPATGGVYSSVDGLSWGLSFSISAANASGYPPASTSATVIWNAPAAGNPSQLMLGTF